MFDEGAVDVFIKRAAVVAAASALTLSSVPAFAIDADEPEFTIMDRAEAYNDVAYINLDDGDSLRIDVMANDMVLEVGLDTVEIVIDDQPFGGHLVKVIPPANQNDTATLEFTVHRRDVTSFVGSFFSYHLELPTGTVSEPASVMVLNSNVTF